MKNAVISIIIFGLLDCFALQVLAQKGNNQSNPNKEREIQDQSIKERIDKMLQEKIRRASVAFVKARDRSKANEILSPFSKVDRSQLIQQILLFLRTGANSEEEGCGAFVLFDQLNFSNEEKISAVIPWLETSDVNLREMLNDVLWEIDSNRELTSKPTTPDYTSYESWLKGGKKDSSEILIKYMYQKDPQAAVLSMSRVYGDKAAETELANKLKGDPKAALQSLADRPEWWAHLYVAETMKKNPQLRDPEILKKLEKDEHPLVREALSEIKSGQSQSK